MTSRGWFVSSAAQSRNDEQLLLHLLVARQLVETGANDEATLLVAARDQLLDEQPRHDGLAGARVVGRRKRSGCRGSIAS